MTHQKWNGHFFQKAPLSTLGLRIQLGHEGRRCSMPVPASSNFLVFDVSGVHQVNVDFCGCWPRYELDKRVQLLWKRWFPATTTHPQTAFTFDCLDTFHELTLQGKMTLYDFYHVLLHKTDNANVHPSIVCILFYPSFFVINLSHSHSIDTRDASRFSLVAKSDVFQVRWPRAWSFRCKWHPAWGIDGQMSGVPSPWP